MPRKGKRSLPPNDTSNAADQSIVSVSENCCPNTQCKINLKLMNALEKVTVNQEKSFDLLVKRLKSVESKLDELSHQRPSGKRSQPKLPKIRDIEHLYELYNEGDVTLPPRERAPVKDFSSTEKLLGGRKALMICRVGEVYESFSKESFHEYFKDYLPSVWAVYRAICRDERFKIERTTIWVKEGDYNDNSDY